ncbi:AbrB family transcriptional regulator [Synechococcus elongatus]|uniref:AbrB family transcriptional regulator n=1 Tax=Synechococcus elongatus PCC 11802 TaxID=2283154 RepID=A0AAU6R5L6_SYNEL|nr:AbrB family transcriptional regulator [Synechococcus elongatus]QFZ93066.1 AbrB family transcriptional regulator [Synechococcus elongatus PCC 11802]
MVSISKITADGQTPIPPEVIQALQIQPEDVIAWEISEDGSARVYRVQAFDWTYLKALESTLTEWQSAADEAAYDNL